MDQRDIELAIDRYRNHAYNVDDFAGRIDARPSEYDFRGAARGLLSTSARMQSTFNQLKMDGASSEKMLQDLAGHETTYGEHLSVVRDAVDHYRPQAGMWRMEGMGSSADALGRLGDVSINAERDLGAFSNELDSIGYSTQEMAGRPEISSMDAPAVEIEEEGIKPEIAGLDQSMNQGFDDFGDSAAFDRSNDHIGPADENNWRDGLSDEQQQEASSWSW